MLIMQYCYFQLCRISNFYTLPCYPISLSPTQLWNYLISLLLNYLNSFLQNKPFFYWKTGSSSEPEHSCMLLFCLRCDFKAILSAFTLQWTDLIQKLIALTLTCFNKPKVSINHFFSGCTFSAALLIHCTWTDK